MNYDSMITIIMTVMRAFVDVSEFVGGCMMMEEEDSDRGRHTVEKCFEPSVTYISAVECKITLTRTILHLESITSSKAMYPLASVSRTPFFVTKMYTHRLLYRTSSCYPRLS